MSIPDKVMKLKDGKILYNDLRERVSDLNSAINELTPAVEALQLDKADVIISSASGAIASFPDGMAAPAKQITVGIEPVQDLHGYENPWPGGGGANKFSGQWPPDVSGTYAGWNTGATTQCRLALFDKGNNSDISGVYFGVGVNGTTTPVLWAVNNGAIEQTTIRTGESFTPTLYPFVVLYPKTQEALTKVLSRFDVMVAIDGVEPSTFAPYSNLCPITGWTGTEIARTGKNLVDIEIIHDMALAEYVFTKGLVGDIALSVRSNNAVVNPTVMSGNYNWTITVSFKDGTKTNVYLPEYSGQIGAGRKMPTVFSASSDNPIVSMQCRGYGITSGSYSVQIEKGSTATTYEAPHITTIPIAFPSEAGTVYGGSLTVNEDGTGRLVVDRKNVDMGSFIYALWNTSSTRDSFSVTINDIKKSTSSNVPINAISSVFTPVSYNATWKPWQFSYTNNATQVAFITPHSMFADATVFNQYVTGVQLVYELEEPVVYTLTALEVLETLKGVNNVWADTGDTTVTYRADTKLYIDNKVTQAIAAALNA